MFIKTLPLGALETNCYVVTDEKTLDCAVIDPGADASTVLDYLESNHLKCSCILLTHGHFDHTGAVDDLMAETGAPLYMCKKDDGVTIGGSYYQYNAPKGTRFYAEGDSVCVGSLTFTVLETPGHTPGSVTLLCTQEGEESLLFTGDTLFRDSCGRTDFPNGSTEQMMASLKRIASLPGDYEVYPGHMSATTLDRERRFNYFVLSAIHS